MKNFKTIAVMSAFTLLCTSTNIQTMGYWKKIPDRIKTIGFCFMLPLSANYFNYYRSTKETTKPFKVTPTQQQNIQARFDKYRPCTELHIIEKYIPGAGAATATYGSKAELYLPPDFFVANSPDEQDAIIAHEATHFSQNHNYLKQILVIPTTQALITGLLVNLPKSLLHKAPIRTSLTFILCGLSAPIAANQIYLVKREKDADLLQKTPEELLNLLKRIVYSGISKNSRVMDCRNSYLIPYILDLKMDPSFLQRLWFISEKLTNPHAPEVEALEYLAHQFKKQVDNPGFDDFPRSEQECKKALSCYFHKEKDYAAGKPYIDHPLIHKRVAFLREQLRWHQNKEA